MEVVVDTPAGCCTVALSAAPSVAEVEAGVCAAVPAAEGTFKLWRTASDGQLAAVDDVALRELQCGERLVAAPTPKAHAAAALRSAGLSPSEQALEAVLADEAVPNEEAAGIVALMRTAGVSGGDWGLMGAIARCDADCLVRLVTDPETSESEEASSGTDEP